MSRNARIRQLQIITPDEEMENLRNEVGVLRRTVESKSAAVGILRAELQECQRERDKFRTLAEDGTLHRSSSSSISRKPAYSDPCRSAMLSGSEGTLAQLLSISKEENKTLRLDSTEMRCKLHDAQADIKVLREEIQRQRGGEGRRRSHIHTATSQLAHQEREQFISQMESLSSRCQALEGDVRGLVEEREELVRELDASSHKLHRLNHILNTILSSTSSANPKRFIDLDAIITENRYLQERIKQTEEEKNLSRSNALKYKAALEKCRTQGSLKLGTPDNLIITPKQVSELLRDYHGEMDGAAETDLKSLCVALVDALNQRSRALRTQRSANKMLVSRVTELERRFSNIGNNCEDSTRIVDGVSSTTTGVETSSSSSEPQITSLGLMEGYIPPSGPIPKYSEEDTMKDPHLHKWLLRSGIRTTGNSKSKRDDVIDDSEANTCTPQQENINCSDSHNIAEETQEIVKNESAFNNSTNIDDHECVTYPAADDGHTQKYTSDSNEEIITTALGTLACDDSKEASVNEDDVAVPSPLKRVFGTTRKDQDFSNVLRNNKSELKEDNISVIEDVSKQSTIHSSKISTYINPEDELEEIVPIDQLDSYIKEVQLKRRCLKSASSDALDESGEKSKTKQEEDTSYSSLKMSSVREVEEESERSSCVGEKEEVIANDSEMIREGEEQTKKESVMPVGNEAEDNDSSFDLDISDYDSDNDNLDLAIQDWQNDFDKSSHGKQEKIKKSVGVSSKEGGGKQKKAASGARDRFSFWQKDHSAPQTELSPALQEFF